MANKHKISLPRDRPKATAGRGQPGQLQEALRRLRRGDSDAAIRLATDALRAALAGQNITSAEAARTILAEAHFRAAASARELKTRLVQMDEALKLAPGLAKLHFHRGLILWQLGRLQEAIPELDTAFAAEPNRPWIGYLRQLARLAAGRPWDPAELRDSEANTLRAVASMLQKKVRQHGQADLAEPLLGKGTELWRGMLELSVDPSAAPIDLLCQAAEKNGRRLVQGILQYYQGIAALRSGERDSASSLWLKAQAAGFKAPWLEQNLTSFLQEQVMEPARAGRWQQVIDEAQKVRIPAGDRSLAEMLNLAHYHLGYEAAQTGQWVAAARHFRAADQLLGSRYISQNLALAEEALGHWEQAAEAWRDMVRRRPRKEDHPDYLSDAQVAAIWDHIAECYARAGVTGEALTTLRTAAKYAPESVDQRLKLVEALMSDERDDAAMSELERILKLEPEHEGALVRLAALYKRSWRDAMPIWRRVLAANPGNIEAREELVEAYLEQVREDQDGPRRFLVFGPRTHKGKIDLLEKALGEMPGHPKLLAEMGRVLVDAGKTKEARTYLLQAFDAAPQKAEVVGAVIHDLLHARADEDVERLLPAVRALPGLLPSFWIDQGTDVLTCKLGDDWARRFFDEALQLVGRPWVTQSIASVLVAIVDRALEVHADEIAAAYEERIRVEAPASGAAEYLAAERLFTSKHDRKGARKLLRKAERAARDAKDESLLALIQAAIVFVDSRGLTPELLDMLEEML